MDPDACLAAMLDAFRAADREAAWEHMEALYDWLAKGGAMPQVTFKYELVDHRKEAGQ